VIWQRHHLLAAIVALVIAAAFLAFMAPELGWLGR